jgi:hypothetical protein
MAAPRHAPKVAFRRAPRGITALALLWMLALALPIGAATTEHVVADRNSGLAIHGFDPVGYFTESAPTLGKGEFEYRHAGVVWRFRNAGNLAAFVADPDVYMPRYGGYDPVGIGRGVPVAGDPRIWLIAEQRLYLFQSPENKAIFAVDSERAEPAADEHWPAVLKTLAP